MYEPISFVTPVKEEKVFDFSQIEKFKIDINEQIPVPEIVLSVCDPNGENKRMVMTRQNISCVTAQAKVGKSFLVKLFISSILRKSLFQNRLHSEMPKGRDKILYIDTEQSKYHVQLGLKQIRELINESSTDQTNNFNAVSNNIDVYQFDAVGTEMRYEFVKHLIYQKKYSLVIIDGISDLSIDTNDLKLADKLVTDLRIWATENDLHILNVIHLNPGDLSHKMKGHLGTKLADKSETVLGVSIDKENPNIRIVQSLATRNRKPDPFAFEITDNGNPNIVEYDITENLGTRKKQPTITKIDKLKNNSIEILNGCFSDTNEKGIQYSELIDKIRREFLKVTKEVLGIVYAKNFIKESIEESKLIYEPATKKYYLNDTMPF